MEEKVFEYLKDSFYTVIEELKRRNPYDPRIREILDDTDLDEIKKKIDTKPVLKLVRDLMFFPLNLLILIFILVDKIGKR